MLNHFRWEGGVVSSYLKKVFMTASRFSLRGRRREAIGEVPSLGEFCASMEAGVVPMMGKCEDTSPCDWNWVNIKNPEAHLMAQELSKLTGESMTTAVTIALRERLDRVCQQQGLGLADRLLAIGKDCAVRLKEPFRSADHGEILYDERGLPR